MKTMERSEWTMVSEKTVVGSGGTSFTGPYNADLQIGITSTGRIAGRRQSGTSGVEFAVGGVVEGRNVSIWIIKDQPEPLENDYFGEYRGSFSPDRSTVEGIWKDIHGNEGPFTMTKVS